MVQQVGRGGLQRAAIHARRRARDRGSLGRPGALVGCRTILRRRLPSDTLALPPAPVCPASAARVCTYHVHESCERCPMAAWLLHWARGGEGSWQSSQPAAPAPTPTPTSAPATRTGRRAHDVSPDPKRRIRYLRSPCLAARSSTAVSPFGRRPRRAHRKKKIWVAIRDVMSHARPARAHVSSRFQGPSAGAP